MTISALKLVEVAGLHLTHSDIHNSPVLKSWDAVKHHCLTRLVHEPIEYLIMLCLDNRNRLIAEETLTKGTVDRTAVYLREVINAVLKHNTKAMILAHNHPSGETTTTADIKMTVELQRALGFMTIDPHNQLIVAGTQRIRFKSLGHL